MAAFTKFHIFNQDLANGVHDLSADQLTVALSNAANAPSVSADAVLADITTIDHTNLSSRNITTTSSTQTGGNYSLVLADLTLTASGAVPAFRYVLIYNDGTAVKTNPLIGYIDYGSEITMANTETFLINFAATAITM